MPSAHNNPQGPETGSGVTPGADFTANGDPAIPCDGPLNPNLIARDLGLADRQELSGRDGGAIETKDVSDVEIARRLAFIFAKAEHELNNLSEEKETK